MKRKINQASTSRKKGKSSCEQEQVQTADFLAGIKCFIHPANFGIGRLNIFQKMVKNYGGDVYSTLPEPCETVTYIIFEESLDIDKIRKLIDPSQYENAVLIKCSWLSACSKSKTKVETKEFEINLVPESLKGKRENTPFSSRPPKINTQTASMAQDEACEKRNEDTCITTANNFIKQNENNHIVDSSNAEEPLPESSTRYNTKDNSESVKEQPLKDTNEKTTSRRDSTSSKSVSTTRERSITNRKFFPKELKVQQTGLLKIFSVLYIRCIINISNKFIDLK